MSKDGFYMYTPSPNELTAIVVTAVVLFATGLFKAAGETTWKAIQDRFNKSRRGRDR
jgi:hypothetical protein